MAADQLFRLIKSLSKNEKVYIKRNSAFHTFKGQKNKYIKLFDALEKMNVYKEEVLLECFADDAFINTLPAARNYLFNVILRNLEAYHHSVRGEIRSCLNQAEILYEKGLKEQCEKIIEKALVLARKYELYDEMYILQTWILNLASLGSRLKTHEAALQAMEEELRHTLDCLTTKTRDDIEFKIIGSRCQFLGQARSTADVVDLENRVSVLEKNKVAEKGPFAVAFMHYQKLTLLYHSLNKPMKELVYRKKKIELLQSNPQMLEVPPYLILYTTELERTFSLELALGYYDQLQESFETLYKQCTQNRTYKKLMQLSLYLLIFRTCMQIGQFEEALKQVNNINDRFNDIDLGDILEIRKKQFLLDCAIIYLVLKNQKAALRCLDELLNTPAGHLNSDLYYFAQILQLLVYFEKGDIELLLYRTRSTYRTLSRNNKLYRVEKLLLDFLRKENEAGWDKKQEKEAFSRLKKSLDDLFKAHPEEKKLLSYFDLPGWVDSKIEKRPLSEILHDRYKRLFESKSGKKLLEYLALGA
jgi:hypothetical protein